MAHTHDVYDTGKYFEINEISRFIKETSSTKLVLVQGDHKSEVITFKMPRLIDGHDMLNCNKIRVHYINIDTKTNDASADIYEVTDLALCEDSEDMLTFTWVVEAPATKYAGTLSFLIKFECTEGENILYQWNTAKYVGTNVLAGIDNSEEFVEKYSNVLNEWYNELTSGADSIREMNEQSIAGIEVARENAKKAIEDKTQESLMYFSENARVLQGYKIIDLYAGALNWQVTANQVYVQHTFDESNTDNIAWCTAKEVKILNFSAFHTASSNEDLCGDISKQYYSPDEDFNVVLYNDGQDDNPKWAISCNMWKSINDPDMFEYVYFKVTIAYAVNIDNTELEDVRVGYDGEVYESAGEAVREQIKKAMQSGGGSVDDEQIKDAVNTYFEENGASGLTPEQVNALDNLFKKCAFTENATAEYEAFKTAFGIGGSTEPDIPGDVTLTSILVTYSGGEVTVGTALTDLTGITVIATYSDGSTANVIGYTLSGTIVEGNNTITVSYGGKTTTFTVIGFKEEIITTLYQVQNKVCNADFYEDTGLAFGSSTANGVTEAWTLVAKAEAPNGQGKCLFSSMNLDNVRWINGLPCSKVHIAGSVVSDVRSIYNDGSTYKGSSIIITHEAGNGDGATLHYVNNLGEKISVYMRSQNGDDRNRLDSMWGNQTTLYVGGNKTSADFVGTILDFAIYMGKVYSEEEINEYLGV